MAMQAARREPEHWLERERRAPRDPKASGPRSGALAAASGWAFVACAAVAIGYGLWALYGSGSRLQTLDLLTETGMAPESSDPQRRGPVYLEPAMSPLRAVLHAAHAPVHSSRLQFEVALQDGEGRTLWRTPGFFGSRDDEASIVYTKTSLATFEITQGGPYFVHAQTSGSSMDDLREMTLELRRNVTRVNSRITWGFGLAALACLLVRLVVPGRRRPRLTLVPR